MGTIIHSNGSKWAGQAPDDIETLLGVLGEHPLHRSLFGGVYEFGLRHGVRLFFGNFLGLSHVFRIETDEAEVVDALRAAIAANVARPDFLSQPTREEAQKAREEAEIARLMERSEERKRQARAVLGL